jgi:hypothetical protein
LYFPADEIRALLRALYRDHFRYPIIADARRHAGDTRDEAVLNAAFSLALKRTRFLGIGNPSESGTHLLYHYRQENSLFKDQFINLHEVFDLTKSKPTLANPNITRYLFIDDFCGSGQQASQFAWIQIPRIRAAAATAGVPIRIEYHVLMALKKGIAAIRATGAFDAVRAALELDETFRAFEPQSRYFENAPAGIDRLYARNLATLFGMQLERQNPLGFDNGQLMLGFAHNTPDNTLPIFSHPGNQSFRWHPLFLRYPKL